MTQISLRLTLVSIYLNFTPSRKFAVAERPRLCGN